MMKPVVAPVAKRGTEFCTDVEQAFGQVASDLDYGKKECMEMMWKIVEATTQRASKDEKIFHALEMALQNY